MQFYTYLVTMNARINQLVKSLLQKDSLDQCSLREVEQFAERYPYFGAAQLLLTKKLQSEDDSRYAAQLQKTYLFFHNPLWVEQLLNETGSAIVQKNATPAPLPVAQVPESPVQPEPEITAITPELAEVTLPSDTPESPVVETAEAAIIPEEEHIPEPIVEELNTTSASVTADNTRAATMETPATPQPQEATVEKEPFNPGMPDAVTGKEEILFEPYHTVDYFASQGIKAQEEENPKDKFTQQLKSFTGWLKTLKKLPVVEINRAPVTQGEHKVEQLAKHSLQEGDVVTEAMAEVWEKQGNNAKAIEIYRKLSLLEPAKSVYFAAKIEDLKKLN